MDRIQLVAIGTAIFLVLFVLEQVRRRNLREEYSWLWLLAAGGYFVISLFPRASAWFSNVLGAERPISTFTFIGVFFLVIICIQFSVRLSRLTNRNRYLAQQAAILDSEIRQLYEMMGEEIGQRADKTDAVPEPVLLK